MAYHTARRRAGRGSWPTAASARLDRAQEITAVEGCSPSSSELARRLLDPQRRRDRRAARPAAGRALEPLPGSPRRRRAPTAAGIAAKGVTGSGYGGHYFWDTEIYVLPFLTYTSPNVARNALRFRQRDARRGARPGAPSSTSAAPCSRGAPSTGRSRRPTTRRARRSTTSTPTSPTRSCSTSRPPATRTSWRAGRSTSSSRRRACGRTSASGATNGDDVVPHPRRHRARRVHDGRQRQPVHERHGAGEPARGRRASAAQLRGDDPEAFERMRRRLGPRGRRDRGVVPRRPRRCTSRTTQQLGIHPQDARSWRRSSGTSSNTPASQAAAAAALPPAGDLPLPGAQAGRRRARAASCRATSSRIEEKLKDFEYYDPLTTGDSTLSAVVQSIIAAEVGYGRARAASTSSRRSSSTSPTCTATRPTASTSPRRAASGARWSSASAACATGAGASRSTRACPRAGSAWSSGSPCGARASGSSCAARA